MITISENPNLRPRPMMTWIAGLILNPILKLFLRQSRPDFDRVTVFQSYFVGDLYMALPAIKLLASRTPTRILCRPDCVKILENEGLEAIPFKNDFCIKPGVKSFFKTARVAWNLRGQLGGIALDPDADSRSALWLRIAGANRIISYHRPHAALFDVLLPLPVKVLHQAEKNLFVIRAFLERYSTKTDPFSTQVKTDLSSTLDAAWIVSCWTRLDTKNWPLDQWNGFLERMLQAGIRFRILEAPDGDEKFLDFKSQWSNRVEFLSGSLTEVSEAIKNSAGVLATDNFVGHMGGYYGKPVLWINGSSDPRHVVPKGPLTRIVQHDPMPCRPCTHHCVNPEYKSCLKKLALDDVWNAFEMLRAGVASTQPNLN